MHNFLVSFTFPKFVFLPVFSVILSFFKTIILNSLSIIQRSPFLSVCCWRFRFFYCIFLVLHIPCRFILMPAHFKKSLFSWTRQTGFDWERSPLLHLARNFGTLFLASPGFQAFLFSLESKISCTLWCLAKSVLCVKWERNKPLGDALKDWLLWGHSPLFLLQSHASCRNVSISLAIQSIYQFFPCSAWHETEAGASALKGREWEGYPISLPHLKEVTIYLCWAVMQIKWNCSFYPFSNWPALCLCGVLQLLNWIPYFS